MSLQLFKNNAYGYLAATIDNDDTSLTLSTGQGARFPNPTGTDYFLLTLIGLDNNGAENAWEIVKCTARSTDTLTVVRAQESTSGVSWNIGTRVELRVTAGTLDGVTQVAEIVNALDSTSTTAPLSAAQGKALNDAKLAIANIDNTPVDGVTTKPISSNWAYDYSVLLATETDNRVLYDEELTRAVAYATDLAGQAARTLSGSLPNNVPASASAPGVAGQMRYASGYLYVCVASNTWQRVAIATWS